MMCKRLWYNWFYQTEDGEQFQYLEVGPETYQAKTIAYHEPQGPGDQHFCDVEYHDGKKERIFNLNRVEFI